MDFVVKSIADSFRLSVDVGYTIYHPLWPQFDVVRTEALRKLASATSSSSAVNVKIEPDWERDARSSKLDVEVNVSLGEFDYASNNQLVDSLTSQARAAVDTHYTRADALWLMSPNQTLPARQVVASEANYVVARTARRDAAWAPEAPVPAITVSAYRINPTEVAVSVSLTNELVLTQHKSAQDLTLYDALLAVAVIPPGSRVPQRLRFAADDPRYDRLATVPGRGRGCVAREDDAGRIVADTLPVHIQRHVESAEPANIDISFANVAAAHARVLADIASSMRDFTRSWDFSAASTPENHATMQALRDAFADEVERFELGCELLSRYPDLAKAFSLANEAFAASRPVGARWRLFQLVFIVSELPALVVRENPTDPRLLAELDRADVLWFPTGGGKTEAYLGLIAVGLFYDRLRGKERGVSAWMLFPLRMLSVQQLARVHEVVYHCERLRIRDSLGGDSFSLGYLVGSGNTPNRLAGRAENGWWPGLPTFSKWPEDGADGRDRRRLVGSCPACGNAGSVGLDGDVVAERLRHVCRSCGYELLIYASDEEIYRYQPSVLVSTIDKITSFAFQGQLTSISRGPDSRCPDHGWFTHDRCAVTTCTATPIAGASGFKDPVPALWVQDELHLVREDLGVFAAHYHTLIAELARGAGHLPSKIIAATATIEQYQDQLAQVYGRTPRMYPTGGASLDRSFYTRATDDVRRLYLGVLPAGGGTAKVDVAGLILTTLLAHTHRLADDPSDLIADLATYGISLTVAEAQSILFNYELALAYVNSKTHGVNLLGDVNRMSDELGVGADRIKVRYLTGETTLGELADTVADVEGVTLATPRSDRIRALIGTSVVSHGVDLDRLNLEVLAGMPTSYAQYIQATARAGRRYVGLVCSVFDRSNRRETSMFQSFETTHAALERMVEPVPVNRFASRAFERTLPGVVLSLLWDETRDPRWGTSTRINSVRNLKRWWAAHAPTLMTQLSDRINRTYRCPVPQPDFADEEEALVAAVLDRWENVEVLRMEAWNAEWSTDLFTSSPMTSLRDVTTPVKVAGMPSADRLVAKLIREEP